MKSKKMPSFNMEEITQLLIGVWRRFRKLAGPSDSLQTREFRQVVNAIKTLQKRFEGGSDLTNQDYFEDPDLLGAYLLYYWVLHYQQGLSLIHEIPFGLRRVLDLGSGPGAFSFAALRLGAKEVVAIDRNFSSLNLAGEICGRQGFPLTVRQHHLLRFPLPVEGQFNLIIVGHCLTELFPNSQKEWNKKQKDWIRSLVQFLSPEGVILFVENSLLHFNHRLLSIRDELIEEGFPVQAPCLWQGSCPALKAKQPCYAQRELEKTFLIKEIQRAAQINLSSLKMSYLIVRHPQSSWPIPFKSPLYRVISPPIETFTGPRYHLCGTEGKRDIGLRGKETPAEARAFDFLKRGELISIESPMIREDHFDIVPDTRVQVEAALNKPLPEKDVHAGSFGEERKPQSSSQLQKGKF